MLKREEFITKGYTEEQTTELIDMFYKDNNSVQKENERLSGEVATLNEKVAGLSKIQAEYNELKQSQLTEQEKIELAKKNAENMQKEAEENLRKSRITANTAKAKEILSEIGGVSEEVLNRLVSDDENVTIASANALLNEIKSIKEQTVNKTKEELSSIDITPTPSNNLETDSKMTWEKFDAMTADEQSKFAEEHPEEFNNL